MSDQAQAGLAQKTISVDKLVIGRGDQEMLRCLAGRVAELTARPIEDEKRELWYRHDALEVTRPLVFCDPENGWNEIITDEQMQCRGHLAREWEMILRKEIFWGESMGDDRVIEPCFDIPYVYVESNWGMQETKIGAVPSLNEERIRTGLRRALQITRNCRVEIIMKDNHTIANNPQNAIRWCQIAREEAETI